MRVLLQRVSRASVTIDSKIYSQINKGLLILVGVEQEDTDEDLKWLASKCVGLRIFDDENGVMNLSVQQIEGQIMVVSQFTLQALTKRGNRPSYIKAAPEPISKPMYERFVSDISSLMDNQSIATGIFGADMKVELLNDGPVTIFIDSKNRE